MIRIKLIHLLSMVLMSLCCLPSIGSANESDGWLTDFEAAVAKAETEKKPLLVNFTGSDWCGWCIRLDKEVFSKPVFKEYAARELVLVEIDFPRRKEKLSEELKIQNKKLAERFGVRGYPTILLLSADESLIGKTGYKEGGAEAYIAHIKKMIDK